MTLGNLCLFVNFHAQVHDDYFFLLKERLVSFCKWILTSPLMGINDNFPRLLVKTIIVNMNPKILFKNSKTFILNPKWFLFKYINMNLL